MATLYWVGGSGTWDGSTTTNWAASSGGAGGAGVPTLSDNAVFDSASNATDYTVTLGSGAACADWTAASPASGNVTFGGTANVSVYGSLLWPATGMVKSYTGATIFAATSAGKTITTNGLNAGVITFDGVNGGWELGGALTCSTVTVTNGDFSTSASGYALTAAWLSSNNANTRVISFNASTITLSVSAVNTAGLDFTNSTNLTLNAGTSQVTISGLQGKMYGGSQTFYNVSFTSTSGLRLLTGDNTFNNLSLTGRTTTGTASLTFAGNQIINGTLTCATVFVYRRMQFVSNTVGTARTLKINAATLVNCDFRDITIDPTSTAFPLTGARIGDMGGNSGITFDTPADKYFVSAAGGSIGSAVWALSSGGAVATTNFPLPQDNIIFDDASMNSGATVTFTPQFWFGSIDCSARTTPMTMSVTAATLLMQDLTLGADVTVSGAGGLYFYGYANTQTVTINGAILETSLIANGYNNAVVFADGFTSTSSVQATSGTLEFLAGATYTASSFAFADTTIESSTPTTQFTLSQASGIVNAINTNAKDCAATGGANWNLVNGSINQGNLSGWYVAHQQNAYYPGGVF